MGDSLTNPTKDEESGIPAASEETSLLSSTTNNGPSSVDSDRMSTESDQITASEILEDEMNQPWPATFDRAVGLLASPVINPDRVDIITRSPKPGGTPLFGARNRDELRNRRFHSPDARLFRPASTLGNSEFPALQKMHSLDFKAKVSNRPLQPFDTTFKEQEQKQADAKAYRLKMIREQNKSTGEMESPGFIKEKQMDQQKQMQKDRLKEDEKATALQCVFNLSNVLLGVGMLALPFVLKSAGWIGGALTLILFSFVTWRTAILLAREMNGDPRPTHFFNDSPYKSPAVGKGLDTRVRRPLSGFPQIARDAFGQGGSIVLSIILYFELFSCLCVFLLSSGEHLYALYPGTSLTSHLITVVILLTIPTALLRTPRLLSYLSMAGTYATIAIVVSVLGAAIIFGDISEEVSEKKGIIHEDRALWKSNGMLVALGLVAFCFSGHGVVPAVFITMQRPQEFERVVDWTYLIVVGNCLLVAIGGYLMFGSAVSDQVTISLEEASGGVATRGLTWLMILTAFSKCVLTMFPLALGMEEIVAPYLPHDTAMNVVSGVIKMIFIGLSLIVSIFVPSFGYLCALVGMICTMTVSVIFPAAAHLKLFWNHLGWVDKALDFLFVAFGTGMAIVGTIAAASA